MYGGVRVRANVKVNYVPAVRAIMHRKAGRANRSIVGGNTPCFSTKNMDSTFKRIPSKLLNVCQCPKRKYDVEPKVGRFGLFHTTVEPWLKTICAPDSITLFNAGFCLCIWPKDRGTVSLF